jgi:endonuclease/exonuclease/phosphatase (EEP) superfamily protein YafD
VRTGRLRQGLATHATSGAVALAAGAAALASLRFTWPRWVPVSSDSLAMAGAFTDFAAPVAAASALLATTALAARPGRGRTALAAVCVGAAVAATALVAPRWTLRPEPATGAAFTVLTLNVRLGQADPAALVEATRTADVVVLAEVTAPQVAAMDRLGFAERFPHRNDGRLPVKGGAGTAVWSRFPVTSTRQLTPAVAHQSWVTTVEVPGAAEPVTVVAVHPARPYRGGSRWHREQEALRAALPVTGPRVLLGDFNAVASHPTQRALRRDGWGSAVEQTGSGWVPTYPAGDARVPPLIDIDHVYLSRGLRATSLRTVEVPGADHLGLLVTVAPAG